MRSIQAAPNDKAASAPRGAVPEAPNTAWPASAALRVSSPHDADEREADAAADAVLDPGAARPQITRQAAAPAPVRRQASGAGQGAPAVAGSQLTSQLGAGEALPGATQQFMGQRLGADFSGVRVHRDASAGAAAQGLAANAFALGQHIAFAPGRYDPDSGSGQHLLAHELAHVAQGAEQQDTVHRHPVTPTPVQRSTRLDLLGDGTAAHRGMTLEDFESSTRRQADWFVEPTLAAADRESLWALLMRATQSPPTLAGVGDLHLADLAAASAADWDGLDAFCRACHGGSHTVTIANRSAFATVAERAAIGHTLLGLEALLPPEVLELTVNETQLTSLHSHGWLPLVALYFTTFQPQLQGSHTPSSGTAEFQRLLDLVGSPAGFLQFLPLWGRVRNLHRFSPALLTRLIANFADFSRAKPLHLVLHTGHDAEAFQLSAPLFEDLVLHSPNLVLMLEGQDSLAAMTAQIPLLAATYGQSDGHGGPPRIAQVMIAGHGTGRSVEMAGTGHPHVVSGHVEYNSESLDLDHNLAATTSLLDTLFAHMDPAQARLVYAGCLVGANPVPEGTPQGAIAGQIAAHPSLGTFTQQRATMAGMPAGIVSSARASVGLSAATSLHDASGNLGINYGRDQPAFGPADAYVPVGLEPEGELVAAVEVAGSSSLQVVEGLLRIRLAQPVRAGDWWDECTRMMVQLALDGVAVGAGVDLARLQALAHSAEVPFLDHWPGLYGISVAHFSNGINPRPFAADLYNRMLATSSFSAPADLHAMAGRLIAEQAFLLLDPTRAGSVVAFLDATPSLTAVQIESCLDPVALAARAADLFPPAAAATPGRLRLALAWWRVDPANAAVRAFLNDQVLSTPAGPQLNAATRAELGGIGEREVLESLGRLHPPPPGVGPPPDANADLFPSAARLNDIRIEPQVYQATVLPFALNVRDKPGMHGRPFAWLARGDVVHVMGFTHDWAAIDRGGKLGFVYKTQITPP